MLFNIAVAQGNLAEKQDIYTQTGLSYAIKLLQQSAGLFSNYKNDNVSIDGDDYQALFLSYKNTLSKIRVAQAQEVCILKAMNDHIESMNNHIAKLAYWCQDLYTGLSKELIKNEEAIKRKSASYCGSVDYTHWLSQV